MHLHLQCYVDSKLPRFLSLPVFFSTITRFLLLFYNCFARFARRYDHLMKTKCVFLFSGMMAPWCSYLHTVVCSEERYIFRYLEIPLKMNHICGVLEFFCWGINWFLLIFPMMLNKEVQSLKVILQIHPEIHFYLTHMMSIRQSEASTKMTSACHLNGNSF